MISLRFTILFTALAIGAFACSSSASTGPSSSSSGSTAPPEDAATPASKCGKPGDVGNSLGVGKYCASLSECSGNGKATLCSKLGDPETFFCTKTCDRDAGVMEQCGENTVCECGNGGCGCTPKVCTE